MSQDQEDVTHASAEPPAIVGVLQERLAAVIRERDELRNAAAEKAQLLRRIDGLSQERDALATELAGVKTERDSVRAERDSARAERDGARSDRDRTEAERARLQSELAARLAAEADQDPLALLWTAISQLAARGVAWLRGKIPEGHPALPWFDKTVETAQQLGCLAVRGARELASWAAPRLKILLHKLMTEVEARLAKK